MNATRALLAAPLVVLLLLPPAPSSGSSSPPPENCLSLAGMDRQGDHEAQIVTFLSGRLRLRAMLQKPVGAGPFPAYVHTHGSKSRQDAFDLGRWGFQGESDIVAAGYVVFRLARKGHYGSEGEATHYSRDPLRAPRPFGEYEALLRQEWADTAAAVSYVRECPFVDPRRISIGGHSTGGYITILAAGRTPGLVGAVSVNGGVTSHGDEIALSLPPTKSYLIREASNIHVPVLVLIGSGDQTILPDVGHSFANELRRLGRTVEVKVYAGGHHPWPVTGIVEFLDKYVRPIRQ